MRFFKKQFLLGIFAKVINSLLIYYLYRLFSGIDDEVPDLNADSSSNQK